MLDLDCVVGNPIVVVAGVVCHGAEPVYERHDHVLQRILRLIQTVLERTLLEHGLAQVSLQRGDGFEIDRSRGERFDGAQLPGEPRIVGNKLAYVSAQYMQQPHQPLLHIALVFAANLQRDPESLQMRCQLGHCRALARVSYLGGERLRFANQLWVVAETFGHAKGKGLRKKFA